MRSNKPPATPIIFKSEGYPGRHAGNRNPQMPIELLATNPEQIKTTNQVSWL